MIKSRIKVSQRIHKIATKSICKLYHDQKLKLRNILEKIRNEFECLEVVT